ncbi:nucleotide-diphospho-sugar transferase [Globomyces pollinis-pini]|nr:nucleotide-diphospho-sugar transferase [Globomyces pollinis-pini]
MATATLKESLAAKGQLHLLDHYDSLSATEQETLIQNISKLDIDRCNSIFKTATTSKPKQGKLEPLPDSAFDSTITCKKEKKLQWHNLGMKNIAENKVAVILLAGGQGTRLGSSDPKGCYDIKLPSGKSLFQLQGERILKLQQLAQKQASQKVIIPWYVMTSGPTRAPTESFFKAKNYFGLDPANVIFFEQGTLPAFTPEGKIFMETKDTPALSPDGNGGIYAALRNEGIIDDLEKRKIPYVHAYCVDNCLVKVADPVFVGYCIEKNADCGAKSIPKTKPEESVGVICVKDGKYAVVEYSEIDPEVAAQRDANGNLRYCAANIANHFYTTEFLKKVHSFEGKLEYHIAKKKIKHVDAKGEKIVPTANNGIKLELFIFDVFPFTERFAVLETLRADEFSPLKNAPGSKDGDSPDTSRADIMAQHVRFVQSAGGAFTDPATAVFEISPLVSYGGEGLEKLSGVTIPTPKHIGKVEDLDALIRS